MEEIALQAVSGLIKAMFLFLLASGLSIIFGVSRVLNVAHGAFYALGAYLMLTATRGHSLNLFQFVAVVIGVGVLLGLVGGVFEAQVLRKVYPAGMLFIALVTFGALLVIEEGIKIGWSSTLVSVPRPLGLEGSLPIGSHTLPTYNLVLLALGGLLALGLWFGVERTRFGLLVRAASMDREMLAVLGVNVPRLYTFTFAGGTALAAIAGALAAPLVALSPGMGTQMVIETFAVVVIGGLGSLPGSLVGAIVVGEFEAFGIIFAPEVTMPLLYLLMALVLVVRPSGLLGSPDK